MSIEPIESRRNQYERILEDWSIHELIGKGSGGKTGVFRITKNQEFEEVGALKVVNIVEIDESFDKIHEEVRKGYEQERDVESKEAIKEVETMYKLRDCPHIMRYLDRKLCDWKDDSHFGRDLLILMDYRQTIWELAQEQPLDEATVIQIGIDVCKALVVCQQANIIHRDIKPTNIFVDTLNHYLLGDFGIARIVKDSYKATTRVGTDPYTAPEQFYVDENGYDGRVDIYSLGLTLYVLCNKNNLPFKTHEISSTTAVQLRLRRDATLPPPCEASDELREIILKACAYRPENRYQSAQEFLEELEELQWQRTDFHKRKKVFRKQMRILAETTVASSMGETLQRSEKLINDARPDDEPVQSCPDIGEDTFDDIYAIFDKRGIDLSKDASASSGKDELQKRIAWLTRLAKRGDTAALCELGDCYMYGDGIRRDEQIAAECYAEAAVHGNYYLAQYKLALCYMEGVGVKQNLSRAIQWLKLAAEQNYELAQYELGKCYMEGRGTAKDTEKAVEWLTRAAEQGSNIAQWDMIICYTEGKAIVKDVEKVVKWLTRFAEEGNAEAQRRLGDCYAIWQGAEQNVIEAIQWYHKAAEQGDVEAQCRLDDCCATKQGIERNAVEDFIIKNGVLVKYCGQDKDVMLPAGIIEIGEGAFRNIPLESISIGTGVEKIGKKAFHECRNLTSITLPNSVTSIGDYAFSRLRNSKKPVISRLRKFKYTWRSSTNLV